MKIRTLGYLGLESTDLKSWEDFGAEVLGAEVVANGWSDVAAFRLDDRHHRIAVHRGDEDALKFIGWEVATREDFEAAGAELERAGVTVDAGTPDECDMRRVRSLLKFKDVAGHSHEVAFGSERVTEPFVSSQAVTFVGLGHAVIGVPSIEEAIAFYTKVLGFRVSDYIEFPTPAGPMQLGFLRCNARHHSLAVYELGGDTRIHHFMLEVDRIDDLGRAFDRCFDRGIAVRALGRHSNDLTISFYAMTPSGFEVEYGYGSRLVSEDEWSVERLFSPALWGHQMLPPQPET